MTMLHPGMSRPASFIFIVKTSQEGMTHRMASLHLRPGFPNLEVQEATWRVRFRSVGLRVGREVVRKSFGERLGLDELAANEGTVPRGHRRGAQGGPGPPRSQPPPAQGSSPPRLRVPPRHRAQVPGREARSPGARSPTPASPPPPRALLPPKDTETPRTRHRNSRENTSGPARTSVGDSGKERKFRGARRASATRSPTPAPPVRRRAAARFPAPRAAPCPRTSAAVGSYVTPGPPEAAGGAARAGAPRAWRPSVWLP